MSLNINTIHIPIVICLQTTYIHTYIHTYLGQTVKESQGRISWKSPDASQPSQLTPLRFGHLLHTYIHTHSSKSTYTRHVRISIVYIGYTQFFVFIDIFFKASRFYCATTSKVALSQQTIQIGIER